MAIEPAGAGGLPYGLSERLLDEAKRGAADVETDWMRGEGHYLLAVEVPVEGGAVIPRIEGSALKDALHGITLPERAVVNLLDQNHRIIYRSQTAESAVGLDLSGTDQLSALNERNTAVTVTKSSVDDIERVYGLSRVGNTGYVVMVGVQSAILYASAWRQLMGYAVIGLIVVFGTVTAAPLIARSIARPVRLLNFAAEEFGLDETKRREYIETISVERDRQIDFVLNLLDLSRIEGGVLRVTHQRVDVQEVISSVVKSETRSAEKRRHNLRFDTNLEVPNNRSSGPGWSRIYITELDYNRLNGLIERTRERNGTDREYLNKLEAELDRAEIVDPKDLPADVITMRSKVRLQDLVSGESNTYSLVFPTEADFAEG